MLTLEQIIELQEKGFTYEQLAMLNAMNLTAVPAEPEKKEPEPEPEKKEPEPEPEPAKPAEGDELAKQIAELTATVKAMQAQNVKQAMQEHPKPLTSEDVIRSFMEAS